jgi:hypothetical protein
VEKKKFFRSERDQYDVLDGKEVEKLPMKELNYLTK